MHPALRVSTQFLASLSQKNKKIIAMKMECRFLICLGTTENCTQVDSRLWFLILLCSIKELWLMFAEYQLDGPIIRSNLAELMHKCDSTHTIFSPF